MTFFSIQIPHWSSSLLTRFFNRNGSQREQERRWPFAAESSRIGVWEIDLKDQVIWTGRHHNRLFGRAEGITNWDLQDFIRQVHTEDQSFVQEKILEGLDSECMDFEYRVVWPDGSVRWIAMSGGPEERVRGQVVRLTGTAHDVTEKKRIEESLQEALFYRDEFLSIASHELKTPLTSLKLQSQLFKRSIHRKDQDAYAPERINRLVGETDRQVDRLVRLVDDMLDISRIRTGKLAFYLEEVNVLELVKEVVERMGPQFTGNGKEVPVLCPEDVGMVLCDRGRMEQVLINLLSNAYRYGNGLPVKVELNRLGQLAQVIVTDRGIGIAPENHEKIFNRFRRAVPASEVSGLGLGLYIARQIMEGHGGSIHVESQLNEGATFKLILPLHHAP